MPDPIPGAPPSDPNAPPAPPAWYAGFDDTTKGHITAKGYDKLEAPAAFAEVFKAYKEAEGKLGIPADRLLRIPDAGDEAGWKSVYQKLGVPPDAAGYDFSALKFADGSAVEESFASFMRTVAAQFNVPKDAAAGIAAAFVKFGEDAEKAELAERTVTVAAAKDALARQWAGESETNHFLANRAMDLIGLSAETRETIAQSAGYGKFMNEMLSMARKLGEAPLLGVGGQGGGQPGAGLTRDQAKARLDDFTNGRDREWVNRYMKGEKQAVDEFIALTKIATGGPR